MIDPGYEWLGIAAVVFFFVVTQLCLKNSDTRSLDEASMIPFADDPEVARRVEQATGKAIHCVDIAEHVTTTKNDWVDVEM